MSRTLWPNFAGLKAPRGMTEMLYDAAGDIGNQTQGKIDFYVDAVGIGTSGAIQDVRYNCYLRVVKNNYTQLLFRVTTPVAGPFPAVISTPEGDQYPNISDETALRAAIGKVLQRPQTRDMVLYLIGTLPGP